MKSKYFFCLRVLKCQSKEPVCALLLVRVMHDLGTVGKKKGDVWMRSHDDRGSQQKSEKLNFLHNNLWLPHQLELKRTTLASLQ